MKLIKVTWLDAHDSGETWMDASDAEAYGAQEIKVTSVGFLVTKTAKYITLAGDFSSDADYGRVTKIPVGMVQSQEEFEI